MLTENTAAPTFSLLDQNKNTVHLKDFLGKIVVLYFYPKDMTPGCTQETCDFQNNLTQFNNAQILGISMDSPESHKKFRDKYNITFPLLADEEGKVCKKYNVLAKKNLFGVVKLGILRTTFVIGPDGKIKKIFEKVKVKGHVDKVLNAVSTIGKS